MVKWSACSPSFLRSEFESRWSQQFFSLKFAFEKNKKTKTGRLAHLEKLKKFNPNGGVSQVTMFSKRILERILSSQACLCEGKISRENATLADSNNFDNRPILNDTICGSNQWQQQTWVQKCFYNNLKELWSDNQEGKYNKHHCQLCLR